MTTAEHADFSARAGELGRELLAIASIGCGTSATDNTPDGQQLKNAIMGRDAWKAECEKERTVSKDLRKDLRERHEAGQAIIKTLETKLADSEREREEAETGFAEARLRANKAEAELVRLMVNTTEIVTHAKPPTVWANDPCFKRELERIATREHTDANAMRAQLERERGHFQELLAEQGRQRDEARLAETAAKAALKTTLDQLESARNQVKTLHAALSLA